MPPEAIATIVAALIGLSGTLLLVYMQRRETSVKKLEDLKPTAAGSDAITVAPSVSEDRLDSILRTGFLKCGVIKHPPLADFQYSNGKCSFGGLYVQIAEKVAKSANLSVEFAAVDWTDLPESFTSSNLDLVLSVFETRQRLTYADFTAPFHRVGVGAVAVSPSEKVQEVSDLQKDDVRIVVSKGEIGWECAVYDLHIPKHRLIVIENAHLPEIVDCVKSGSADVAIFDDVSCHECVTKDPTLVHLFAHDSLYMCKNSIMIPKGEPRFARWVEEKFLDARNSKDIVLIEDDIISASNGLIRKFR